MPDPIDIHITNPHNAILTPSEIRAGRLADPHNAANPPTEFDIATASAAIDAKHAFCGGKHGFLGEAIGETARTPEGHGFYRGYKFGRIYWTHVLGGYEVHGAIYDLWATLGFSGGSLGFPITDELPEGADGRVSRFQNGGIVWFPASGAKVSIPENSPIADAFNNKYLELGGRLSVLGLPDTNIHVEGGLLVMGYQGGGMRLEDDYEPKIYAEKSVKVHFQGLYTYGTQEWSAHDEPYAIATVYSRSQPENVVTKKFGPFEVNDSNQRIGGAPTMIVDRAIPNDLVIVTVLMESNEGDSERVREAIENEMRKVADQILASAAVVAGSPSPIPIPDSWKDVIFGKLSAFTTDFLRLGDEVIGTDTIEVKGAQLQDAAKMLEEATSNIRPANYPLPTYEEHGIKHTHSTDLLSLRDSSFKVFYTIEPYVIKS